MTITATTPQRPIPSGIAGQGYYAAFSTVTAVNHGSTRSSGQKVKVQVPVQTDTANFVVTPATTVSKCTFKTTATVQTWTCTVPRLAAGAKLDIATIVGSESHNTGLPATVVARATGPDGTVIALTWQWVLPYSQLSAVWTSVLASTDWGAPTTAILTVANSGIWASPIGEVVAIRPSDPAAFNIGWRAVSPSGSGAYCAWDTAGGSPDGASCDMSAISPGGSRSVTVTAYPEAPLGGPLTLVASDSTGNFTVPSPAIAVNGTGADLSLSIANLASVEAGSVFPRTYTITNIGSTEALNVVLTDQSSVFGVGTTTGPGTCVYHSGYRVGGRINCSFGTIPPNGSVTLVAQLTAPPAGGTFTTGTYGSTSSAVVPGTSSLSSSTQITVYIIPPASLTLPTLIGTPQVGQVLTATWGSWSGTGSISVWAKLCHSSGTGCSSDIASTYAQTSVTSGLPSATAFTYTVPVGDVGTDLVLYVSATNAGGVVETVTLPIGPVAP